MELLLTLAKLTVFKDTNKRCKLRKFKMMEFSTRKQQNSNCRQSRPLRLLLTSLIFFRTEINYYLLAQSVKMIEKMKTTNQQ